jgi:hypothetical protein
MTIYGAPWNCQPTIQIRPSSAQRIEVRVSTDERPSPAGGAGPVHLMDGRSVDRPSESRCPPRITPSGLAWRARTRETPIEFFESVPGPSAPRKFGDPFGHLGDRSPARRREGEARCRHRGVPGGRVDRQFHRQRVRSINRGRRDDRKCSVTCTLTLESPRMSVRSEDACPGPNAYLASGCAKPPRPLSRDLIEAALDAIHHPAVISGGCPGHVGRYGRPSSQTSGTPAAAKGHPTPAYHAIRGLLKRHPFGL